MGPVLASGTSVTISGVEDSDALYLITLPARVSQLHIETMAGSGDVDPDLKFGNEELMVVPSPAAGFFNFLFGRGERQGCAPGRGSD